MIVLTSDRGLCGSFNSSVLKAADRFYAENKKKYAKVDVYCLGRRAGDFFRKRNVEPVEVVVNLVKDIKYEMAQVLTERLLEWYDTGAYDEVQVVYNEFKSAISQVVVQETVLPVPHETLASETENTPSITFEPEAKVVLDQLLKRHFAVQVYRCMQESIASEHGARMNAMENATKNAGEMIRTLTLTLNKIRQATITTELIEITSGAEEAAERLDLVAHHLERAAPIEPRMFEDHGLPAARVEPRQRALEGHRLCQPERIGRRGLEAGILPRAYPSGGRTERQIVEHQHGFQP